MLAAIHHNENLNAEASGRRVILRESGRVSRASDAPNPRIHKTQILEWQQNFVRALNNNQLDETEIVDELAEEFEEIHFDELSFDENEDVGDLFVDFLENNVIIE